MTKKIFRAIIIALFCFNACITNVYAETKVREYYSIDLDTLNINVKQYLTSLSIDKSTKQVYMNNVYVGIQTNDTQTFTLSTTNYTINAKITLSSLSVDASVNVKTEKIYKSAFKFEIEDNTYYVCYFYPDYENSSTSQKLVAVRNGETYNFNTFSYTYGNEYKEFNVKLIQSSGDVYVNGNKIGTLSKSNLPIVFEYIGNNFPITSIDYMHGKLAQFNWDTASQAKYPFYNRETDFSNISIQQNYEYSNEYLSLPSVIKSNTPYVNEYKRVGGTSTTGTGVWQPTGNKIWVVCEYYENEECGTAIRKEFPRYWAVYASEAGNTFPVYSENNTLEDYVTKYRNYYYNTTPWYQISYYPSFFTETTFVQYSTRMKEWGDYGAETTYYIDSCSSNADCDYKVRNEYSNYMYGSTASGYTDGCTYKWYEHNYSCGLYNKSCATSACGCASYKSCNTSACGYASCATSGCGCASYKSCATSACGYKSCATSSCGCASYKSCQNGSACGYSVTCKNSGGQYKSGTNSCPSGYPTLVSKTAKTCQASACGCSYYQSCKSSACGYATCQNSSCGCSYYQSCKNSACGYAKCQNSACGCSYYQTCNHQDCGTEYGSCNLHYCPQTRVQYFQYRYKNWGDWSSWYTTSNQVADVYDREVKYQYNNGIEKWDLEKGSSVKNTTSKGWYTGDYLENEKEKINVDIAKASTNAKSYNNKSLYTQSDVLAFQSEYARDKSGSSYLETLRGTELERGTTTKFIKWSDFNYGITNYSGYTQALNNIKNSKIYSPYLYFYGWRFFTDNVDMPSGTAQKNISAADFINYSSTGKLLENSEPMERDTKVIYFDYHDPLTNYDEYPENWQGYEELVRQIENSDLSNAKIKVKLSADDITKMKEYLENGGYDKVGDCSMIREFSYIFITTDTDLQNWFNSGSSCKIGD